MFKKMICVCVLFSVSAPLSASASPLSRLNLAAAKKMISLAKDSVVKNFESGKKVVAEMSKEDAAQHVEKARRILSASKEYRLIEMLLTPRPIA